MIEDKNINNINTINMNNINSNRSFDSNDGFNSSSLYLIKMENIKMIPIKEIKKKWGKKG